MSDLMMRYPEFPEFQDVAMAAGVDAGLTRYKGGKNGAGVYQSIINAIPKHEVYVEAFAGSAGIYRRKCPAASSILIEKNKTVADRLAQSLRDPIVINGDAVPVQSLRDPIVINGDAVPVIEGMISRGEVGPGHFFYLDPPYLHETRTDKTMYGKCELSDRDHEYLVTSLLPAMTAAGASWALSGYWSIMYDDAARARGWWRKDFNAMTRRGLAVESLWTNYDFSNCVPAELKFTGDSFRERERIKRKAKRWLDKLLTMPDRERLYIMEALASSIASRGDAGQQICIEGGPVYGLGVFRVT